VLGATIKGEGYLHGNGYVVAWAIGHLMALAQPYDMIRIGATVGATSSPMLPKHWPPVVYEKTKDQFEVMRKISDRLGSRVWFAPPTSAARES
jgi:DNA topoisomerase-3